MPRDAGLQRNVRMVVRTAQTMVFVVILGGTLNAPLFAWDVRSVHPTLVGLALCLGYFTFVTGAVIYSVSLLASLAREVRAGRGEPARMAVVEERLRVARGLHD